MANDSCNDYTPTNTSALQYDGASFTCMSNLSGQALNDVLQIFGNSICTLLSTVSNLQAPEDY